MDVTPKSLEKFRESLAARGLGDGTQRLYIVLVNACAEHPKGLTARLLTRDLAPKSLRTNRAALLAWARFSKDAELKETLEDIRLPPAARAKPKIPFEREQWKRLVHEIRVTKALDRQPALRAALLLVALRGIRMSDAARVRKGDVISALRNGRFSFVAKGSKRLEYDAASIREPLEMLAKIKGDWSTVEDLLVSDRCRSQGFARRHTAYTKMDRALRKLAKKCGIRDVHGHRFRRTYAVSFLRAIGNDPQALIKLTKHVGWSSIQTASGYVDDVSLEELDKIGSNLTKDLMR